MKRSWVVLLVAFVFISLPANGTRPVSQCERRGYIPLDFGQTVTEPLLLEVSNILEQDDWSCTKDKREVSCTRPRIADERNGIYKTDEWRSLFICRTDKSSENYVVYYVEKDGAIEYQNEFEDRFGYPRDPERYGRFYFSME